MSAETHQAATVDTSFVVSILQQLPNDHLMFLIFSHPAIHFVKMLQKQLRTICYNILEIHKNPKGKRKTIGHQKQNFVMP